MRGRVPKLDVDKIVEDARQFTRTQETSLRSLVENACAALRGMGIEPYELGMPEHWTDILEEVVPAPPVAQVESGERRYLGLWVVPDRRLTVYSQAKQGRFIVLEDPLEKAHGNR